jgi:hypothetical protein
MADAEQSHARAAESARNMRVHAVFSLGAIPRRFSRHRPEDGGPASGKGRDGAATSVARK